MRNRREKHRCKKVTKGGGSQPGAAEEEAAKEQKERAYSKTSEQRYK